MNRNDDRQLEKAYQLALKRLTHRDYTRFEISEYIKSKLDVSEETIETVLLMLEKHRFVDDQRYLKERASYLRYQLRGDQWIFDDLKKRGLKENDITHYLAQESSEETFERALKRAKQFMKRSQSGSQMQRENKLKAHLVRQGYDFNVINRVVEYDFNDYSKDEEKLSLNKLMTQAYKRYEKKYDGNELKQKLIQHALSKGYPYEMIKEVMEEYNVRKD